MSRVVLGHHLFKLPNRHACAARGFARVGTKHLLALLDSWRPVTRPAPAVCNGNDTNDVGVAAEDERIREALQWKTAMAWVQFLAKRRKLDEHRRNPFDLQQELISQSLELSFIVFDCFDQFLFGGGKELDFPCLRRARTRSNTVSAGIDWKRPASKSALLRCTSSSQARSASGSTGPSSSSSRVRRRRSCSGRARCRISLSISDIALAITCHRDCPCSECISGSH